MQTAQPGDRVQIHFVKRFSDGSVVSSRDRAPLELSVGAPHPRLPGLGLALVGLAPGDSTTITVTPEHAYGVPDPSRVRRLFRARFPADRPLSVGKWVPIRNRKGRRRLVRILEVGNEMVVVDTNHRRAGQTMEVEVQLLSIAPAVPPAPEDPDQDVGGEA
jgi:FKBP-type peptidyl-prolyl cis-trans isomerase 2